MSTIKVTNLQATGETATRALSGVAAAWHTLNMQTASLLDSSNISSITDSGTGLFDATLSSAMANANYCATVSTSVKGSINSYGHTATTGDLDGSYGAHSTTVIRSTNYATNTSPMQLSDAQLTQLAIHGDLA